MKRGFSAIKLIIIILAVIIIISLIYLFISNKTPQINSQNTECLNLGCPEDAIYAGSKNSDKYYQCSCRYAKTINSENIICFSSDKEAQSKNYKKIDC